MKVPIKSSVKEGFLKSSEDREIWLKLVVKIISWREGKPKEAAKISPKEWNFYHKRSVEINSPSGRDKILSTLRKTKGQIQKNGGFI